MCCRPPAARLKFDNRPGMGAGLLTILLTEYEQFADGDPCDGLLCHTVKFIQACGEGVALTVSAAVRAATRMRISPVSWLPVYSWC